MASNKELVKYLLLLIGVAFAGFMGHLLVLFLMDFELFENAIIWSYIANTILAGLILAGLLKAPEKYQSSLGYLFLFGSFLKFAIFFIAFNPLYKADGEITAHEFSTYFVPYALCLITETSVLINKLNRV